MQKLRIALFIVLAGCLTGCASPSDSDAASGPADQGSAANLDGVYEFVRLETPDGPQTTQQGVMIVQGNYLCHVRVQKEREKFSEEEPEQEQARKAAAAFNAANAACGHFNLNEDRVSATWSVSAHPNLEGNTSEFILSRQGDETVLAPAAAPQFQFVYRKINTGR